MNYKYKYKYELQKYEILQTVYIQFLSHSKRFNYCCFCILTQIHNHHSHGDGDHAGENLYSIKWYKDQQEFYRSELSKFSRNDDLPPICLDYLPKER